MFGNVTAREGLHVAGKYRTEARQPLQQSTVQSLGFCLGSDSTLLVKILNPKLDKQGCCIACTQLVQGYLAHKKPPHPRSTIGWSTTIVLRPCRTCLTAVSSGIQSS